MSLAPSGEQFTIRHGQQLAVVTEVGAGLRAYAAGDWHLLDGYDEDQMCPNARGALLAPWPNRVAGGRWGDGLQLAITEVDKGHAIHGLSRWHCWRLVSRATDRVRLELVLPAQPGYPFVLELEAEYALSGNGLAVSVATRNAGAQAAPFGLGQHPYFSVGTSNLDLAVLEVPASRYLEIDERMIPTGRMLDVGGSPLDFRAARPIGAEHLDKTYTAMARDQDGRARVRLRDPGGGHRITVWMDAAHEYVTVFSADTVQPPSRRRQSLAIEPLTCAPDAFNNGLGLRWLQPGETFSAAWGVELSG